MKQIALRGKHGQGKYLLVDDEDFDFLSRFSWVLNKSKTRSRYCPISSLTPTKLLIVAPKNMLVDHKDGDTLNVQKHNLRICTPVQNNYNTRKRVTVRNGQIPTSQYKGVSLCKDQKWQAMIAGKYLGRYTTQIEAAQVYDKAAVQLFGEFAKVNGV